jgi:hypothetical protein
VTCGGAVDALVAATGVGEAVGIAPIGSTLSEPLQAASTKAAPANAISLVIAELVRLAGAISGWCSTTGSAYPQLR